MIRTKIANMQINERINTSLVVTSATARKTKAGKDFLTLELFDGEDLIVGNYWDWAGQNIPKQNSILNITAQVTEYLEQKQLNITSMTTNHEAVLAEFMPKADVDIEQAYKDCYAIASDIKNDLLRQICWEIFDTLREEWIVAPAARSVHHSYVGGTLVHTASVAKITSAIVAEMPQANADLAIAGALLHDVGKLWTYNIEGISVEMSDEGILMDHLYLGAKYVEELGKKLCNTNNTINYNEATVQLLTHIILSHHGVQQHGSITPPMLLEAHIVHHADTLDAIQEQIRTFAKRSSGKFTDKIWTLENKPHIRPQYTDECLVDNSTQSLEN